MDYTISKREMRRNNKEKANNYKCNTIMMRQKRIVNPDKIFQDSNFNYWKSCKFFKSDPNDEIVIIREFCFKDDTTIFCMPAIKQNKPSKKINSSFVSTNYYKKFILEI